MNHTTSISGKVFLCTNKAGTIIASLEDGSVVAKLDIYNPEESKYKFGDYYINFSTEVKFTARIHFGKNSFVCRLEPGDDPDVVQLGIGGVRSHLSDSIFDPSLDTAIRFQADQLQMQWQDNVWKVIGSDLRRVDFRTDLYRFHHKLSHYKPLNKTVFKRAPAGWSSWLAYAEPGWINGIGPTEEQIVLNIDWLAKHLRKFGLDYVQIDDGWQANSPDLIRRIGQEFYAPRTFDVLAIKYTTLTNKQDNRLGHCIWRLKKGGLDGDIVAQGMWKELEGSGWAEAEFYSQVEGKYTFEIIGTLVGKRVGWHSPVSYSGVSTRVFIEDDELPDVQMAFRLHYQDGWETLIPSDEQETSIAVMINSTFKIRSWEKTSTGFTKGMKWLAEHIKEKGLRPGIWVVPFGQSDSEMFSTNPEMFLKTKDGKSPLSQPEFGKQSGPVYWIGRYFVDPTTDKSKIYLRELFEKLANDWGYEYIKIDGQGHAMRVLRKHLSELHRPTPTPEEAYLEGLRVIKEVMGKERFLLNCGGAYASCGLCQGIRIGDDSVARWEGVLLCVDATCRFLFLNNIAFWTDPDMICVGTAIPYEQAVAWATFVAITGQLLMISDRMYDISEKRLEILRRIFPVADIHPMDLYPIEGHPHIFDLKISKPDVGVWDVVAIFNWGENLETFRINADKLGLQRGEYIFYDVWEKQLIDIAQEISIQVWPTSCRLLTLHRKLDRPQVIGTSRHITQGADDLEKLKWDAEYSRLVGRSCVVGGDPYEIRCFVPPGWQVVSLNVVMERNVAILTLREDVNCSMNWEIEFLKEK